MTSRKKSDAADEAGRKTTVVDASHGGKAAVNGGRNIETEVYIEKQFNYSELEKPIKPGMYLPFPRYKKFVGRRDLLEKLHEWLMKGNGPVGLHGLGGAGKTQLAVEYLYRNGEAYPGGVFWFTGNKPETWEERLQNLAMAAGALLPGSVRAEEAPRHYARALVHYLNNHPDAILVMDDIEPEHLVEEIVPGFVPARLKCRVLFTTRRKNESLPCRWLEVREMGVEEALEVLLSHPSRLVVLRSTHPEHQAARELCRGLHYLPLSLALAGAYLGRFPSVTIKGYLEWVQKEGMMALEETQLRRADLPTQHDPSPLGTLRVTWKALMSHKEAEAARLVLIRAAASGYVGEVPREQLALLTGLSDEALPGHPSKLDKALALLRQYNLIEDLTARQVRLHPLVREFVPVLSRWEKEESPPAPPGPKSPWPSARVPCSGPLILDMW